MAFSAANQSFSLETEDIRDDGELYYHHQQSQSFVTTLSHGFRQLPQGAIEPHRSILAQRRDPETYPNSPGSPKITNASASTGNGFLVGTPSSANPRRPTCGTMPWKRIFRTSAFFNRLKTRFPAAKRTILEGLANLYAGITDFDVSIEGGTVQVFFTEGEFSVPATRLSDGTLRYLCLLAILCDPEPPPLICIEEPELGLHPDILPGFADLLRSASERTQLIVTTHSDILVDAMTETPEAVVVCSKERGQTTMQRLNPEDLKEWLAKYRLGQLWVKGEIGGTRW